MITDHLPEIVQQFIDTAKLLTAVMRETNADTMTQETFVTHFASGDKYKAKMVITREAKI